MLPSFASTLTKGQKGGCLGSNDCVLGFMVQRKSQITCRVINLPLEILTTSIRKPCRIGVLGSGNNSLLTHLDFDSPGRR